MKALAAFAVLVGTAQLLFATEFDPAKRYTVICDYIEVDLDPRLVSMGYAPVPDTEQRKKLSTATVVVSIETRNYNRRHFLLKEGVQTIEKALEHYPGLLSDKFENGQTPLSVLLNFPGALSGYNRLGLLDLVMDQDPVLGTNELVGLGRCEKFKELVKKDPESLNLSDPDGNTPLFTAVLQAPLLKDGGCLTDVVEAGAVRDLPDHIRNSLGRIVAIEYDDELLHEVLTREWNSELDDKELGAGWRAFYRPMALIIDLKKSDLLASFSNN